MSLLIKNSSIHSSRSGPSSACPLTPSADQQKISRLAQKKMSSPSGLTPGVLSLGMKSPAIMSSPALSVSSVSSNKRKTPDSEKIDTAIYEEGNDLHEFHSPVVEWNASLYYPPSNSMGIGSIEIPDLLDEATSSMKSSDHPREDDLKKTDNSTIKSRVKLVGSSHLNRKPKKAPNPRHQATSSMESSEHSDPQTDSPAFKKKRYETRSQAIESPAARDTFFRANLQKDNSYLLRSPNEDTPGAVIDDHQKKHTPPWPVGITSGKNPSTFPKDLSLGLTVQLAWTILDSTPLFNAPNPRNPVPPKISHGVKDITPKKSDLRKILENSGIKTIGVQSGYMQETKTWSIHFHPEKK